MNKIKFSDVKALIINSEISLLREMEIRDKVDYSDEKKEIYEDINKTKTLWDIVIVLGDRGYDNQSSIDYIFNEIIDFQN